MVVATIVSACGGGGSTKSTTSPTTAAGGSQAPDREKYCGLIRTYSDRFAGVSQPGSTPAQIKTFAQDVESALQSAVAVAPAEIKSDTTVVAGAANGYLAQLKRVDYDLDKLPPDAASGFQAAEVAAAAGRLQTYSTNVCGTRRS